MAEQSAKIAQRCEESKSTCELNLEACDLRKFPDAVFFLMKEVKLQSVTLAHNSLTKIPGKLGVKFSSITTLTLSHNQLSSLPEDLSALLHLQELNLSSNLFETFPPVLRLMPALTTVDLSYNRLTDVHAEDVSGVQSLETVDLRGNPLTQAVKTLLLSMVRVRVVVEEEEEENERELQGKSE